MEMTRFRGIQQISIVAALAGSVTAIIVSDRGATPAATSQDFGAVSRYVFVPSQSTPTVSVIETADDRIVGTIDTGIVPAQTVVSEAVRKLAAIAAGSRVVSIVELKSGQRRGIELDFVPQRLLASVDGNLVAAVDLSIGTVAFIELAREREVSRVTGLLPIRDLMFGADGAFIYVAADGLKGIGVVDIARGKLVDL